MYERQAELMNRAKAAQTQHDEFNLHIRQAAVDENGGISDFPINSYVLLEYHGKPPKLNTPLKGPLRVVSREGADYTLENLVDNKVTHVHASKLRQFEFDPQYVDPREVAMKEQKVYDIERILSHTGNRNKHSSLSFRVKWVGYDQDDCTYESWHTLRNNEVLHKYLIEIGWTSNVPKRHRFQYPLTFPDAVAPANGNAELDNNNNQDDPGAEDNDVQ